MNAIVYILYNANASVLGKVQYAYRKLTAPATDSPCAACDLTHGGLRLTETPRWSSTKARIGAAVQQLHKDEADRTVCRPYSCPSAQMTMLILGLNRSLILSAINRPHIL